jgi:hypothetical protein
MSRNLENELEKDAEQMNDLAFNNDGLEDFNECQNNNEDDNKTVCQCCKKTLQTNECNAAYCIQFTQLVTALENHVEKLVKILDYKDYVGDKEDIFNTFTDERSINIFEHSLVTRQLLQLFRYINTLLDSSRNNDSGEKQFNFDLSQFGEKEIVNSWKNGQYALVVAAAPPQSISSSEIITLQSLVNQDILIKYASLFNSTTPTTLTTSTTTNNLVE